MSPPTPTAYTPSPPSPTAHPSPLLFPTHSHRPSVTSPGRFPLPPPSIPPSTSTTIRTHFSSGPPHRCRHCQFVLHRPPRTTHPFSSSQVRSHITVVCAEVRALRLLERPINPILPVQAPQTQMQQTQSMRLLHQAQHRTLSPCSLQGLFRRFNTLDIVPRWLYLDDSICPSFNSPELSNAIKHEPPAASMAPSPRTDSTPTSKTIQHRPSPFPPPSEYHPSSSPHSHSLMPSSSSSSSCFHPIPLRPSREPSRPTSLPRLIALCSLTTSGTFCASAPCSIGTPSAPTSSASLAHSTTTTHSIPSPASPPARPPSNPEPKPPETSFLAPAARSPPRSGCELSAAPTQHRARASVDSQLRSDRGDICLWRVAR